MSSNTVGFIQLPVCLPGLKDESSGIDNPDRTVPGRFIPQTIIAYHESYFKERTLIYLNNGQPFLLDMTLEAYEKAIQAYVKAMATQVNSIIKQLPK